MKETKSFVIVVLLSLLAAHAAQSEERVPNRLRRARERNQRNETPAAQPGHPAIFPDGQDSATFKLTAFGRPADPSPEKELLHGTPNRQAIATLLKEERNRMIKPGLSPPDDEKALGIKIRFDAIRFLPDPNDPDKVRVRLVGPINEIETRNPLSVKQLLESTEPIPVRFESVTRNTGVTVTITTDLKLKWDRGDLLVTDTKGTFDFEVGRFSPARLLYSSDSDSTSLPDLHGKRVSEDTFVRRSLLEPEKL